MSAVNHNHVKLGKKPPKHDPRTLRMANYLGVIVPPPPAERHWSKKADPNFGMMLNDQLGDCTCAAIGHAIQVWTANTSIEVTPPDSDILQAYETFCGYDPKDPSTDQGGVELDVLKGWRATGVGGHKIDGFVALEPKNHMHVRAAIDMFGVAYSGVALPLTAQNQKVWSVIKHTQDANPGSWGGHAISCIDYDASGIWCITWGELKKMTWQFWDAYMDESYAVLSPDWSAAGRQAPSGFDYAALAADLAAL